MNKKSFKLRSGNSPKFKEMGSSPVNLRKFGVGEKEAVSPTKANVDMKNILDNVMDSENFKDKEKQAKTEVAAEGNKKGKGKKALGAIGDILMAGIDAGAGTSYGAKKEKEKKAKEIEEKTQQKVLDAEERDHQRKIELLTLANKKKDDKDKDKEEPVFVDSNNDGINDADQPDLFNEDGSPKENKDNPETENTEE